MLKFNIGVNRKKYTHDKSFHIDTTADFGSFQPILCDFLSVGDTANMRSFRQLVRNAVMPSPTFGDIKCLNRFSFVPVSDVFPAFEAMLAHQSVKTGQRDYIPLSVPLISSTELVAMLMSEDFSSCCFFDANSENSVSGSKDLLTVSSSTDFFSFYKSVIELNLGEGSFTSFTHFKDLPASRGEFSPDASDFRLSNFDLGHASKGSSRLLCIRLNALGRRLYNIFRGLGYSLDPLDNNEVSALPIFAFFKAWFDNFFPTRDLNFQSTFCFKVISSIYEYGFSNLFSSYTSLSIGLFSDFLSFLIDELSFCFYTFPDDFVSAHRLKAQSTLTDFSGGSSLASQSVVPDSVSASSFIRANANGELYSNVIDYPILNMLVRASKFLTKNSLIGSRIHEYIKVHFGQAVYDSIFAVSNDVASFVTDIKLDDIYSTSDTLNQSTGQPLGSRGGIGSGYSDDSFIFKAHTFGFLIGMTAIYPDSYFCQGDDPQLYMTSRFTFPSADFDALGYELTPLACIYDNHGRVYGKDVKRRQIGNHSSFGFIPRYSGLKTKRNLLNGDMARLSTADSFRGYYLDRLIFEQTDSFEPVSDHHKSYVMRGRKGEIPTAGTAWKQLLRYPQLGYFDRIFLNADLSLQGQERKPLPFSGYLVVGAEPHDNNFTIQCNCSYFVTNALKPLSNSFDTFDDDVDNSTVSVSNV